MAKPNRGDQQQGECLCQRLLRASECCQRIHGRRIAKPAMEERRQHMKALWGEPANVGARGG
jgi:hypothetical protein